MAHLGIDIGTTSLKGVLVCNKSETASLKVIHEGSIDAPSSHDEQSVNTITTKIRELISGLCEIVNTDTLNVKSVSICCQMHGVVLWDRKGMASNLITWQDSRCDEGFLSKLQSYSTYNSCDLHSGYGNASLAWLAQNITKAFKDYDFSGTIADYFVYILCNLTESVISDHNAESWGFFDSYSKTWDQKAILKSGIPIQIMPKIISAGKIIGKVSNHTFRIVNTADVYVPIGDLQGSVYAILQGKPGRVFNYGTASQLVGTTDISTEHDLSNSVRTCLYTKSHKLLAAASLNGGNAVEVVIKFLNSISSTPLNYEDVMDLAMENKNTTLMVKPTFFGERHNVGFFGSIHNINVSNFSCGGLVAATFKGIVENLCEMMPSNDAINELPLYAVGIGGREVLKHYLLKYLGEFSSIDSVTAATGSVLFNLDN